MLVVLIHSACLNVEHVASVKIRRSLKHDCCVVVVFARGFYPRADCCVVNGNPPPQILDFKRVLFLLSLLALPFLAAFEGSKIFAKKGNGISDAIACNDEGVELQK